MADPVANSPRVAPDGMPVDRPIKHPDSEFGRGYTHAERDFHGFSSGRGFVEGLGGDRQIGKAKGDRMIRRPHPAVGSPANRDKGPFRNLRG